MQDMFENAKRVASTAVERAAWEADKLRRSSLRQHDLELAQRERTVLLEQLATLVLDLDQRGQLNSEALHALAQRLRTLDADISRGQADVRTIREEPFTPGTISINVSRKGDVGTTPCTTCGQPVRKNASYCAACGARLR
jgi:zinc ribbon protein